jgi:predicted nucleic acid-binding protein
MRVVDSSVAAKWFVAEPDSPAARALLQRSDTLVAPDLLVAEVCNALWQKVRNQEISADQALLAASHLPGMFDSLVEAAALIPRALELALRFDQPLYDCLYVALAEIADAELVSADAGLCQLARQAGLPARRVKLLTGRA